MKSDRERVAEILFNKYGGCIIKESTCEHIVNEILEALKPEVPQTFMGYTIPELIKIINFAKSVGYPEHPLHDCSCNPKDKMEELELQQLYPGAYENGIWGIICIIQNKINQLIRRENGRGE